MSVDPRTGITLLSTQQRYKEQIVNEGFAHLGAIATGAVVSLQQTSPPSNPNLGEVYFVPSGATGVWAGHENKLALKIEGGWTYFDIPLNHRIYSQQPSGLYRWDGDSWIVDNNGGASANNAERLGGELPSYYLDLRNHTGELPANSLPGSLKIILQSPKTFYVSPTGVSSNNGLTPDSPKSLQSAINLFVDGYVIDNTATIQMADGTYEVSGLNVLGFQGNSQIVLRGNPTDPSAVVVQNSPNASMTLDGAMHLLVTQAANINLNGISFKSAPHSTQNDLVVLNFIYAFIDTRIAIANCVFDSTYSYSSNPFTAAISGGQNSRVVLGGSIEYKGDFDVINNLDSAILVHNTGGETLTNVNFNNVTFGSNVSLSNGALWLMGDAVFTGSPTGKRFSISGNSILSTNNINPNTALPGTIAGTVNNWLGHPFNTVVTGTGGEANTASNTTTSGYGIFKQKVGVDLVFKCLKQGANTIFTEDEDSITIASTGGGSSSASFNSNEEILSANKTLTNSDVPYQYLNPGTANRDIILPASPTIHKFFRVRSTNGTNNLIIKEGTLTLVSLGNSVDNGSGSEIRLMADFHHTGTRWIVNLY